MKQNGLLYCDIHDSKRNRYLGFLSVSERPDTPTSLLLHSEMHTDMRVNTSAVADTVCSVARMWTMLLHRYDLWSSCFAFIQGVRTRNWLESRHQLIHPFMLSFILQIHCQVLSHHKYWWKRIGEIVLWIACLQLPKGLGIHSNSLV